MLICSSCQVLTGWVGSQFHQGNLARDTERSELMSGSAGARTSFTGPKGAELRASSTPV